MVSDARGSYAVTTLWNGPTLTQVSGPFIDTFTGTAKSLPATTPLQAALVGTTGATVQGQVNVVTSTAAQMISNLQTADLNRIILPTDIATTNSIVAQQVLKTTLQSSIGADPTQVKLNLPPPPPTVLRGFAIGGNTLAIGSATGLTVSNQGMIASASTARDNVVFRFNAKEFVNTTGTGPGSAATYHATFNFKISAAIASSTSFSQATSLSATTGTVTPVQVITDGPAVSPYPSPPERSSALLGRCHREGGQRQRH